MERLHLSWEGLLALARRLAEALREEEFDLILGIARGGLIPTALLQALSVRDILTAAVMFYEGEKTLPEPVFLQFPLDPLLFGKRVLVVDDVWDSGRTALAVKERVRQAGGVPLVATLHFKPGRNQVQDRPDFYAEETEA
jgi:hypoxanthine phosphoribosyltransferase